MSTSELDALRWLLDTLTAQARQHGGPEPLAALLPARLALQAAVGVQHAVRHLRPSEGDPSEAVDEHVVAAHGILSHLADLGAYGAVGREAHALLKEAFPMGVVGHLQAPGHTRPRLDRRLYAVLCDARHASVSASFGLDTLAQRLLRLSVEREERAEPGRSLRLAMVDATVATHDSAEAIRRALAHDRAALRAFLEPWGQLRRGLVRGALTRHALAAAMEAPVPPRSAWHPSRGSVG